MLAEIQEGITLKVLSKKGLFFNLEIIKTGNFCQKVKYAIASSRASIFSFTY